MKYLSKSLEIKGKVIKNRFAVSPMVTNYCNADGTATERFIAYHEQKAKGGFGLIITEDFAVDPAGKAFANIPGLWCDEQMEGFKELPRRVHAHGAVIFAQIYHCGRQTKRAVSGMQPVAPSLMTCPCSPDQPHELTIEEIRKIVSQYGDAALRAKKCGFDGVEIHGAHGYLIAQFMSLYSNKRTDEYGGNLMNRLRFPIEIIKDVREKCGEDFIIDFRISGDELVAGGRTIEDTCAIAPILEEAGIDLIHISVGVNKTAEAIIPSMYTDHAWITDWAAKVKKVVNIPVMTVGRINDPLVAERVLAAGKADMIVMGRQSLCDPETPNKALEGRFEDIRTCIACCEGCIKQSSMQNSIGCILNPLTGNEYCTTIEPAAEKKKVAVIGGGISGMEAARIAAERGHDVTVFEKEDVTGGQFRLAAIPPNKGEIAAFVVWQRNQAVKNGAKVLVGTKASVETIKNGGFDEVIVATGATPVMPGIKGIENANVVQANDILAERVLPGKSNVVIGGGQVGTEVANHLGSQFKKTAIIEMREDLALEEFRTPRLGLLKGIRDNGVEVYCSARVTEITDHSVKFSIDEKDMELPADRVIISVGSRSNNQLAKELEEAGVSVTVIGDAAKTGQAGPAIKEGFRIGNTI